MSIVSVFNIFWYLSFLFSKNRRPISRSTAHYDNLMKWLALPYVVACAWRSFWPNCYNARIVMWDVWMSSVFVGRLLATVAEVAWITQVGWCVLRANEDIRILSSGRGKNDIIEDFINGACYQAIFLCTIAQGFCVMGMFTENHLYGAIEESLWGFSLFCLFPCCVYLHNRAKKITIHTDEEKMHVDLR